MRKFLIPLVLCVSFVHSQVAQAQTQEQLDIKAACEWACTCQGIARDVAENEDALAQTQFGLAMSKKMQCAYKGATETQLAPGSAIMAEGIARSDLGDAASSEGLETEYMALCAFTQASTKWLEGDYAGACLIYPNAQQSFVASTLEFDDAADYYYEAKAKYQCAYVVFVALYLTL